MFLLLLLQVQPREGDEVFFRESCRVTECKLTSDRKTLSTADLVIFRVSRCGGGCTQSVMDLVRLNVSRTSIHLRLEARLVFLDSCGCGTTWRVLTTVVWTLAWRRRQTGRPLTAGIPL